MREAECSPDHRLEGGALGKREQKRDAHPNGCAGIAELRKYDQFNDPVYNIELHKKYNLQYLAVIG
jgi:hypothetical protein